MKYIKTESIIVLCSKTLFIYYLESPNTIAELEGAMDIDLEQTDLEEPQPVELDPFNQP